MLSARWSVKDRARALKISNDIAEGDDCGESRAVLRQTIAIFADMYADEVCRRSSNATEGQLKRLEALVDRIDEGDVI